MERKPEGKIMRSMQIRHTRNTAMHVSSSFVPASSELLKPRL